MDARQSFKFAFIANCIERGITSPEAILSQAKQASEQLEKQADFLPSLSGLVNGVKEVATPLALTAAVAPPLIGGALGSLAGGAMNDMDDYDVDDAKNNELIDEYRRQAMLANRRALLNKHMQAREHSGRVFL